MVEAILVAAALIAGLDLRVVGLLAVAAFLPLVGSGFLLVHLFRNRQPVDTSEAAFCQSVARELRSGSSLRSALQSSAGHNTRLHGHLAGGRSLTDLTPILIFDFELVGRELGSIVEAVGSSGTPSAKLFDEIADLALAQLEIAEDIRVATAPARASAFVLIGLPVAYLSFQFINGSLESLLRHPAQQLLTLVGWGLVLMGIATSWFLIRRTTR